MSLYTCLISVVLMQAEQHEAGDTRGSHVFSINLESKEGKLSTKQVDNNQQKSADINVSVNNEKENILNLSSSLDIPNIRIGMSDQLRKRSALSEALEASDDSKFVQLNAEVKGKEAIGGADNNPESSESILYKLFGNASTLTSGIPTSIVEVIEEIIGIPYTCVAKKVLTAVWKIPF
jgi:hypothetical protein